MKVVATQPGFYGRVYRKGEQFDIPDERFSKTWMEKVEPETEEKSTKTARTSSKSGSGGGGASGVFGSRSTGRDAG